MKKIYLISFVVFLLLVALLTASLFFVKNSKKADEEKTTIPTKQASTSATKAEENVDEIIRKCMLGAAAPGITDVKITKKVYYTDGEQTQWLRFLGTPVPENATDPAYGVMKKVAGGKWEMVDFGTCCIEDNLPADVQQGLGFR